MSQAMAVEVASRGAMDTMATRNCDTSHGYANFQKILWHLYHGMHHKQELGPAAQGPKIYFKNLDSF